MRTTGTITGLLAALASFVLYAVAFAQDYSLLEAANGGAVGVCTTMDGEKVRCRKFNPRETPAPTARPTPTPTRRPIPCEMFDTRVTKTFEEGEEKMLCFDVRGPGNSIVTVGSQNVGNVQCAQMQSTLIAPSGQTYDSMGALWYSVLP